MDAENRWFLEKPHPRLIKEYGNCDYQQPSCISYMLEALDDRYLSHIYWWKVSFRFKFSDTKAIKEYYNIFDILITMTVNRNKSNKMSVAYFYANSWSGFTDRKNVFVARLVMGFATDMLRMHTHGFYLCWRRDDARRASKLFDKGLLKMYYNFVGEGYE
jgi:hypothetical protein